MDNPRPPPALDGPTISDLWQSALAENRDKLNFTKDQSFTGEGIEAAMSIPDKAKAVFQYSRQPHGEKRRQAVRHVETCLRWVELACNSAHDNSTGAFSEPVVLVAGGIAYMLKAARDVKEDLDTIERTLDTINQEMDKIKDIGIRVLTGQTLQKALINVFVELLKFCSYAGEVFEKHNRIVLWMKKMIKAPDNEIVGECNKVKHAISEFESSIPHETMVDVKDIKEGMTGIKSIIEHVDTMMQQFLSAGNAPTISKKKPNALDRLVSGLESRLDLDLMNMARMATRMMTIRQILVPGTFAWLKDQREYEDWQNGQSQSPFLYVEGEEGRGKTYLIAHCSELVQENAQRDAVDRKISARRNLLITYFFCNSGETVSSASCILATILYQIAGYDPKWCESISRALEREGSVLEGVWRGLIERFRKQAESPKLLYILLDDVWKMDEIERAKLLRLFRDTLSDNKYNIRILLTGRPQGSSAVIQDLSGDSATIPTVTLEWTKTGQDIKLIIDKRIQESRKLRALTVETKQRINNELRSKSKGDISLVDLMMGVIEQKDRHEDEIMKLISSNTDLYGTLTDDAMKGRDELSLSATKLLFSWCTFAKQPMSMNILQHLFHMDESLRGIKLNDQLSRLSFGLIIQANPNVAKLEFAGFDSPGYLKLLSGNTSNNTDQGNKHQYLQFRYGGFKNHMEKGGNKIIHNANSIKVDMFVTLSRILCDPKVQELECADPLHDYAAVNILGHLKDISIDRITEEELLDVGNALYRLMTNQNNVSKVFQKVQERSGSSRILFDLYDSYKDGEAEDAPIKTKAHDILLPWVKRLGAIEATSSTKTDEIRTWASEILKNPQSILDKLGHGHLDSWIRQNTVDDAWIPYQLVARSLSATRNLLTEDDVNWEVTKELIEMYPKSSPERARARISAGLLLMGSDDEEKHKKAEQLYRQNIQCLDEAMSAERFYSFLGLAEWHYTMWDGTESTETEKERLMKIFKYVTKAVECWNDPKVALSPIFNGERFQAAFVMQGAAYQRSENLDQAAETCIRALTLPIQPGSRRLVESLTVLLNIYSNQEDSDSKIIRAVRSQAAQQSPRFIAEWVLDRSSDYTNKRDILRKAATATGQVDFIIELYEQAIKFCIAERLFQSTCILLYELAVIYRRDANSTHMAEEIFNGVLKLLETNTPKVDPSAIGTIVAELLDIIFERYTKTQDKARKSQLCDHVKWMQATVQKTCGLDSAIEAVLVLTLARMLDGLGRHSEAKEQAKYAFDICIADLQDTIDDNDFEAFRALAKVLYFAGLETDARIALSLQFTKAKAELEGAIEDFDSTKSLASSIFEVPMEPSVTVASQGFDGTEGKEPRVEDVTEDAVNESSVGDESSTDHVFTPVLNSNGDDESMTETLASEKVDQKEDTPQIDETVPEQTHEADDKNREGEAAHVEETTQEDTGTKEASVQEKETCEHDATPKDTAAQEERAVDEEATTQEPEAGQEEEAGNEHTNARGEEWDATNGAALMCNGHCTADSIEQWTPSEPYLFCVDCFSVDYCEECHKIEEEHHSQLKKGFWFKSCWGTHTFLRQPIDNWQGVSRGIIVIHNQRRRLEDWLGDVKYRWERAIDERFSV